MKRENLRLSGLPENEEETEDVLIQKVCGVAREVGVELQLADFSSCHRLGKPRSDGRPRQAIVRFLTRRKRDAFYQARFNLKGKEAYKYLGGKPDSPDMGCCKHMLGINVLRGPPCTTSRWTTLTIFCWKEMAAIFQNGRHVNVILRNIQDNVRTEPHFTMCWVSY